MNKNTFGIIGFGIANIIIGAAGVAVFFVVFLMSVVLGWVTDKQFYGSFDWFYSMIIYRLYWVIFYLSFLILFYSGVTLLRKKTHSRKLAIISSSAISSVILFWTIPTIMISYVNSKSAPAFLSPWNIILPGFLLYAILLITYLMDSGTRRLFDDRDVKFPYLMVVIFILALLFIPLIWSPNR